MGPNNEYETIDIVPIEEGESYALRFIPKECGNHYIHVTLDGAPMRDSVGFYNWSMIILLLHIFILFNVSLYLKFHFFVLEIFLLHCSCWDEISITFLNEASTVAEFGKIRHFA